MRWLAGIVAFRAQFMQEVGQLTADRFIAACLRR